MNEDLVQQKLAEEEVQDMIEEAYQQHLAEIEYEMSKEYEARENSKLIIKLN